MLSAAAAALLLSPGQACMVALAGRRQGIAPTAAGGRGMEGGMEGSRLAW